MNAGLLDVQAIAEQVRLHTNTVRAHLDQLVDAGLVESEVQERKTPGRPRILFRATPAPGRDGPEDSYKVLAEVLANGIRDGEPAPGAVAAKAGRRWGQRRQQQSGASAEPLDSARALDRVVALLDDVGFAPRFIKATGAKTGTADSVNADDATVDAGDATVIEVHSAPSTTSRASTPTSSAPCTWASSRGRWTRCRPHPALSASSPSCARTCAWYTSHPLSSVTPAREHEPRPDAQ